jgi:hypothetical protein
LKTTIDPDDRLKRTFAMLFSDFLRNPHSSSRDVSKALFAREQQFSEDSLASG